MRRLGDVSLRLLLLVFLLFRHFSFFFSSSSFHVGLPPFLRPFSIFAYGGISSGQLHSFSFMPVMTKETSRRLCSSDFSQPTRPRQSSGFGQARRTIDIDSVSFPSPCFPSLPSSFISGRKRKNGALLFINSVRSQKGNDASLGYLCGEGFLHGDPSTEKRIDTERARSTSRFAGRSGSSSFSSTISQTCFCPSSLIGRDRRRSRERDAFLHANFTLSFPRFFHQRLPSFLYLPFPSAVGKARLFMPKTDGYDRRDSWKPSCSFPSRTKGGELARGIPPTEARNSGERRRSGVFLPTVEDTKGEGNHLDVLSWLFNRRRMILLQSSLTDDVAAALIAQLLFLSQSPSPSIPNSSVTTARQGESLFPASWSNVSAKLRSRTQEDKDNQGELLDEKKKNEEENEGETCYFGERREEEEGAQEGGDVDEGRKRGRDEHEEVDMSRYARDDALEKLEAEGQEEGNEGSFVKERKLKKSDVLFLRSRSTGRRRESLVARLMKRRRQRRRTRTAEMRGILSFTQVSLPPIEILINSPGGSVTAALSVLNIMQSLPCEVVTTCTGQAGGVAALLLAAGTPGLRRAFPTSRISLQQVEGSAHGQAIELDAQSREVENAQDLVFEYLSKFCNPRNPSRLSSSASSSSSSLSAADSPLFSSQAAAEAKPPGVSVGGLECAKDFVSLAGDRNTEDDDGAREGEGEKEREEGGEEEGMDRRKRGRRTGKDIEKEVCRSGGLFMNAQEALDFGLIDTVLMKR